jgi:DNA-binding transcriptional ArsR family regulator
VTVNIDSHTAGHTAPTDSDQIVDLLEQESRVFFALSDVTRLRLLDRLLDNDGQRQAELTAGLNISRQAAVKHLEILAEAHLVTVDRINRAVVYRLNRSPLRTIKATWMDRFIFVHPRVGVDCGP